MLTMRVKFQQLARLLCSAISARFSAWRPSILWFPLVCPNKSSVPQNGLRPLPSTSFAVHQQHSSWHSTLCNTGCRRTVIKRSYNYNKNRNNFPSILTGSQVFPLFPGTSQMLYNLFWNWKPVSEYKSVSVCANYLPTQQLSRKHLRKRK
jgi:hypothetical protein